MYSEWSSLQDEIQCDKTNQSVLHKFPAAVGTTVATSVVKHIATSLSIAANNLEPCRLDSDKEVKWAMEVLCYGLSLPLAELDTIKECVNVYCNWLLACMPPSPHPESVPKPLREDPDPYIQDMIHHLLNLFVPRPGSDVDSVRKQAVFCHRVLRQIQLIAKESTMLSRESWETLLKFLLAANDSLLSPPLEKDDIGDQLCERVLSVLFEIWLLACHKCFPSPSLWKTFRAMCISWRHHESLVVQWHKVNHALTCRVLSFTQGPDYPKLTLTDEDSQLIPPSMTYDCIAQCWFRFLHIVQNPVDLCRPETIGKTHKFMQAAMNSNTLVDPTQHECLLKLPFIFYKAMKGVSVMVNAFLGIPQTQTRYDDQLISTNSNKLSVPSTPPGQRKTSRPMSVFSSSNKGSSKSSNTSANMPKSSTPMLSSLIFYEPRQSLAPTRPRCDSILHLFGAWLFDAALARVRFHNCHRTVPEQGSIHSDRRSSSVTDSRRNSVSLDYHQDVGCDNTYEMGRAEALGTLCRIFCAHKTGETILPVYYSRFYLAMYYGLQTSEDYMSGQVLASVLFNSCDILRVDLDGVQMLLPHILDAIQLVLNDLPNKYKSSETSSAIEFKNVDLQRSCINLLLSTLCLPLHFKDLTIRDIVSSTDTDVQLITFISLKKKILDLILGALKTTADSTNTQMLLGGLMLLVEDLAVCDLAEQTTFQPHDVSLEVDNSVFSDNSQTSLKTSSSESSFKEGPYHRLGNSAHDIDSAYGLFGESVALICHRLMSQWKGDLNSALAAMEILAGLAKLVISPPNLMMCKCTVKWICEFIVQQCNRPAPAHSKDLHSTIVAAFRCLMLWLVEHSRLLYDKECLHVVLEVVELGISGSKSQKPEIQSVQLKETKIAPSVQNRASDPPRYKQDKQRQPASKRVQEAAEGLLTCIIQHVGAFPPPCGPESLFSLLDEKSLLKYTKGNSSLPEHGSPFRYFVLENSIVIGLLEQPLGNIEDPLPTVTALIRGPFGRHAWVMQLRHSPRIKRQGSSKSHLADPGRPVPMENVGTHHTVRPRNYPESVDKVTQTKADKSIPTLESLVTDENRPELNKLKSFMEKQAQFEDQISQTKQEEMQSMTFPNQDTECKPPKITEEFQAARLFLSHYGFLSLDALKEQSNGSLPPSLVTLDTTNPGLSNDLEVLDTITARDNDTVHVFYVKSGQRLAQDILRNVESNHCIQTQFLEFLHSLGWPVDIQKHAGWTGHISTSWKISQPEDIQNNAPRTGTGGSIYDGQQQVLYWADVSSEVAFVVPSLDTFNRLQNDGDKSPHISLNVNGDRLRGTKPTTLTMERPLGEPRSKPGDSPGSPHDASTFRTRRFGRASTITIGPDTKIFVVWLENFEDHENFPTGDLLPLTNTGVEQYTTASSTSMRQEKDIFLIFIHALQNGLFRIHMEGNTGRISMAIPLVDGMVVSRRTLGSMVRQTAINIGRRKRLESESYQPPHVRRKIKIQEIVDKYHLKMTESEFYTALFQDVHK
ncbi:ral GTPase-activating protein subunit beta-like isoform X3 [Ostrea edulis]|uniref:ral GTPase-activating protein subunit beta-like isoform X3 n=1 Tax=Ostrea edulis TaxID=37623 RepID=UPI0024AF155E|nr:ral GTPase-activating protein subunit beta-like isoform X3 [Ostrea edulis]